MTAPASPFGPSPADRRARQIVTPEGVALPFRVASRTARIAALLLDYAIILAASLASTFLAAILAANVLGIGQGPMGNWAGEFLFAGWLVLLFAVWNGYFIVFEMGPRGATPGKRANGLRVAAHDGGRLSPEAVIARNLLRQVEIFLPLVLLAGASSGQGGAAGLAAFVWFACIAAIPLLNRDALRAGDFVAGTWVVEAPRTRLPDSLTGPPASTVHSPGFGFTAAQLEVYGEKELVTLERVLRSGDARTLEAVRRAIARKLEMGAEAAGKDDRAFLEAYYTQLRARLEGGMRLGRRKRDKHG